MYAFTIYFRRIALPFSGEVQTLARNIIDGETRWDFMVSELPREIPISRVSVVRSDFEVRERWLGELRTLDWSTKVGKGRKRRKFAPYIEYIDLGKYKKLPAYSIVDYQSFQYRTIIFIFISKETVPSSNTSKIQDWNKFDLFQLLIVLSRESVRN